MSTSLLDHKEALSSPSAVVHWEKLEQLLIKNKSLPLTNLPMTNRYIKALEEAPDLPSTRIDLGSSSVQIGGMEDISLKDREKLEECLRALGPWKKGPFNIYGIKIDSEWRSDLKWSRLSPYIGSLEGMTVADIGCHNGYYMFRMAASKPKLVLGVEPYLKHAYTFQLLQKYAKVPNLCFEQMGVEDFHVFEEVFDHIFCLGILYHHRDPIGILQTLYSSLKKKGKIVIDCQTIPGEEPINLMPKSRYAGACSIWFVPTKTALTHWMIRAGFKKIQICYDDELSTDEQRSTDWAQLKSLEDFLDPTTNNQKTVEGYPRPRRTYLIA